MFSLGQKFGKGSAGWFWIGSVLLFQSDNGWIWKSEGKEKLEAGSASLPLHMISLNIVVWASSQHGGLRVVGFITWLLRALVFINVPASQEGAWACLFPSHGWIQGERGARVAHCFLCLAFVVWTFMVLAFESSQKSTDKRQCFLLRHRMKSQSH